MSIFFSRYATDRFFKVYFDLQSRDLTSAMRNEILALMGNLEYRIVRGRISSMTKITFTNTG
jgi:hypothetical protein